MFERARKALGIEKNSKFVERVLFLTFPTALVFVILAAFRLVDPMLAVISLGAVVLFNIVLLFPLTFELQQIKNYVNTLSNGGEFDEKTINLSEKDAKEIVTAVNAMHRFWAQKTDMLEAQTISDTAVLDSLPDPIMMIDRSGNIWEPIFRPAILLAKISLIKTWKSFSRQIILSVRSVRSLTKKAKPKT